LRNVTASGVVAFDPPQPLSVGATPLSSAGVDVNGDGRPDVLAANNGGTTFSILLSTQYRVGLSGSPATGTIQHDRIFFNGFD
jgi:hypothetical protein